MGIVNQDNITDVVIASLGKHGDVTDRQREIMASLIRHMHGFTRDVKRPHREFLAACDYLARAGKLCNENRQEFILLGDILGVEVLVDMMTNPVEGGESESTVLPKGGTTIQKHYDNEETAWFEGTIKDEQGRGIAGVTLDVWEDAPNGIYENLDPDQPEYNLRGRFEADENDHYAFFAVRPVPYPIPEDETAGELLRFMGHHPNRPGHMHFIMSKDGYRPLISQIYDADSKWLEDDSVFAVKQSLIGKFKPAPAHLGTDLHFEFDFVLKAQAEATALAAE